MRVCMHACEWVDMRGEAGRVGPTLLPKKLLSGSITSCLCLSGGPTRHTQVSWWASEELLPVSVLGISSGRTPPRTSREEPELNVTPPTAWTQRRHAPKHSTSPPPTPPPPQRPSHAPAGWARRSRKREAAHCSIAPQRAGHPRPEGPRAWGRAIQVGGVAAATTTVSYPRHRRICWWPASSFRHRGARPRR